jgi:hypothetical protein
MKKKPKLIGDLPNFWKIVQSVADAAAKYANRENNIALAHVEASAELFRIAEQKRRVWRDLSLANMEAGIMTPKSIAEENQLFDEFKQAEKLATQSWKKEPSHEANCTCQKCWEKRLNWMEKQPPLVTALNELDASDE